MTTLPALTPIVNGTPNDATPVDTNFDNIATHISNELINRDGSLAMGGELTLSSSTPSGALVAASKSYVDTTVAAGVGALSVDTDQLVDLAVTTAKLDDDAVTSAKIAPDAVGSSEIAPGAVGTSEIGTGAVDTAELANDAVDDAKIGAPSTGSLDGGNVRYARYGNLVSVWTCGTPTQGVGLPVGFRPAVTVWTHGYDDGLGENQIVLIQAGTGGIACTDLQFTASFSTV